MFLPRTDEDLNRLTAYLVGRYAWPQEFLEIQAHWSTDQDQANAKSPRAFCHVLQGEMKINCARALEDVSPQVRIGVLLHELGHIYLQAFKQPDAEVQVDEFCIAAVPEAGYHYASHKYYYPHSVAPVMAENVEHVSKNFVGLLHGRT
jgi:hypothetical protein